MSRPDAIRKIWGHPLFATGVALLLLNDWVLKPAWHNAFTGKLSDFAGLAVFPAFWCAFLRRPKIAKLAYMATALFFIWWKLPVSQPVIDFFNIRLSLPVARVVDGSDLWALVILPLSYKIFIDGNTRSGFSTLSSALSGIIAFFSFCATSPAGVHHLSYPIIADHQHKIDKYFSTHQSTETIIATLRGMGIRVIPDSVRNTLEYRRYDKAYTRRYSRFPTDSGKTLQGYAETTYVRSVNTNSYKIIGLRLEQDTLEAITFTADRVGDSITSVHLTDIWSSTSSQNAINGMSRRARRSLRDIIWSVKNPDTSKALR